MDTRISSNIKSVMDIFFKQLTEVGSLTIITALSIFIFFFDKILALKIFTGVIVVTIISFTIKALFFKERPKKQKFSTIVERIDASSFPSVHSGRITILTFWLVMYVNDIILKIFLTVIGLIVAYSRIYLKKHYLNDVIGGIVLGIIVNVLIYLVM